MNELEQLKEDLRKALERVEQLEKQQPKQVTLDEILGSFKNKYWFQFNLEINPINNSKYWNLYKDQFEAEHEMWRLILKRVAQYLNEEKEITKATSIIIGCSGIMYEKRYSNSAGYIIFNNEELAKIAVEIIGEDNTKRALSEEYCRNNPKTE